MKTRAFIAIVAPPELQKNVADWQARSPIKNVRWLATEALHITLIPPFYVDEKGLEEAKEKCRSVRSGAGAFAVKFDTVSFGPDKREPRLIWASGQAPAGLITLQKLLAEKFGTDKDQRKFLLHLTIARFKPEAFRDFEQKELNEAVAWKATASSFSLISSKLTPAGAVYEVLEDFKL
jgi:RNA 2',3'-cyclic 3'-phosphodiesterase